METMILGDDFCDEPIRQYPKSSQRYRRISIDSKCGILIVVFAFTLTCMTAVDIAFTFQVLTKLNAFENKMAEHLADSSQWKHQQEVGTSALRYAEPTKPKTDIYVTGNPGYTTDNTNMGFTSAYKAQSQQHTIDDGKCMNNITDLLTSIHNKIDGYFDARHDDLSAVSKGVINEAYDKLNMTIGKIIQTQLSVLGIDIRLHDIHDIVNSTQVETSMIKPMVDAAVDSNAKSVTRAVDDISDAVKAMISNETRQVREDFLELANNVSDVKNIMYSIQAGIDVLSISSTQNRQLILSQTEELSVRFQELSDMVNTTRVRLLPNIYKEDNEGDQHHMNNSLIMELLSDTINNAIFNSTIFFEEWYSNASDVLNKTLTLSLKRNFEDVKYHQSKLSKAISSMSRDVDTGFNDLKVQLSPLTRNYIAIRGWFDTISGQIDRHAKMTRYSSLAILSRVAGVNSSLPCYKVMRSTRVTWDEAKHNCEEEHGYLAEIHDQLSLEYVRDVFYPRDHLWLGGSDRGSEGIWYWQHSRTNITVLDWKPGQPDNWRNGEHCMHTTSQGFNDVSCNGRLFFLCQRDDTECGDWVL